MCKIKDSTRASHWVIWSIKGPPVSAGDPSSIPGSGRSPGGGHGNPLQYSCLENRHGHRSLAGYSPWGRKESDTTERLTLSLLSRYREHSRHSTRACWVKESVKKAAEERIKWKSQSLPSPLTLITQNFLSPDDSVNTSCCWGFIIPLFV